MKFRNKDQVKKNSKYMRSKTFSMTSRETRICQEGKGNVAGGKFKEVTWTGPWNDVCHMKVFAFSSNCDGYSLERFQEKE